MPNIFEALLNTIKTSLDYDPKHQLHTGEVTSCWIYYTAMKEFIRYEEIALNTTVDDELLEMVKDAKKMCESQVMRLESFLKKEGIPLPQLPDPKPKSDPNAIPLGAKLTDDEISNGLSIKVATAIVESATTQAQSVRSDVGAMMVEFQLELLLFGSTLKSIMRKRGWLRVPPFYNPPVSG